MSVKSFRFIAPNQRGVPDIMVATAVIVAPIALGLGACSPLAVWMSVATGAAVLGLSLLTDYRFGLMRVIPFRGHLTVDGIVGAAFAAAPFMLGFAGLDALYYWVNGAAVLMVVGLGLTKAPEAQGQTRTA